MNTTRELTIRFMLDLKEQGIVEILSKSLNRDIADTKWRLTPFGKWLMDEKGCQEFTTFARIDNAQLRKLRQEFELKHE